MKCRILLAGYYGFNNIGDEAILEMFLRMLKEKVDNDDIKILTADPIKTERKFKIKGIDRYSFFKVNKAIIKSDIIIIGGGSLLQDVTSKRSIYYYLYIIFIAKILRKKIALLSQGIGPIKSKVHRYITSKLLNKVDYISVRDKQSIKELRKIGVDRQDILYSADPVINYKLKKQNKNNEKINIGISLRSWNNSNIIENINNLIKRFDESKYIFTFIPFHFDEDIKILEGIEEKSNCIFLKDRLSIEEIYNKITELDLIVGVRLHSLIFAAAAEIPVVGISYDPKVENFLKSIGEKTFFYIENFDEEKLYEEILNKLKNKNINTKKINELRNSRINNIKVIDEIIDGCRNG